MTAALALITLGVADVARATRFYQALGFALSASQSREAVSFFAAGGVVLALFGRAELAAETGLPDAARGGFGGIALARNLPSRGAVDRVFEQALAAGASVLREPADTSWGGYAGYVADPDGHPLELAWNPYFPLRPDGTVDLPM